ncbi:UPF0553 protein C9orf64-like protein [Smittium mucronatum]|uniref:Queuosine 5'-phosphate N-glycosylase/hydrolase n=1 Tax=Smittium mucronatum TaxID=133383 RepID=A0A1R0H6L0_9FUNG|nr:UPF0553 protein C9orf64-like protein [Smittium mucronatum]
MSVNPVRDSAKFISENSTQVSINTVGVVEAARKVSGLIIEQNYSKSIWQTHPLNPKPSKYGGSDEAAIDWLFVVDTLNFCFWNGDNEPVFCVEYKGSLFSGYWGLCAAVNRALDEGIPFTNPEYLSKVKKSDLEYIFRTSSPKADSPNPDSDGFTVNQSENSVPEKSEMKMLNERVCVLTELGQVTISRFGGKFINILKSCENSAVELTKILSKNFSSFNDSCEFKERTVNFFKRAQILCGELWACFEGLGYGHFDDINELTMFADYRVPQILVYLGILEYSPELTQFLEKQNKYIYSPKSGINKDLLLPSGSQWEVEIRGNSIHGVELLKKEILKLPNMKDIEINSVLLDFCLWDCAKANSQLMEHIPIHLTLSVYY